MGLIEWIIALVLLAAISWVMVEGEGHVLARAGLIVLTILSSLYVFQRIDQYRGTPLHVEALPEDLLVYGSKVDEDLGIAYILCGETADPMPPVFLSTNITKSLQQALQEGRDMRKGKPFRLKSEKQGEEGEGEGEGEMEGEGQGEGEGAEGTGGSSNESERDFVVELPPLLLPEKK